MSKPKVIFGFDGLKLEETLPAFAGIDHSIVRYSHVWEDHRLVRAALRISSDDRAVCIASAGCNVFDLVLAGAREVHAVDLSTAQIALVELKIGAIKSLTHKEMLGLLGYQYSSQRTLLYEKVRSCLPSRCIAYWDDRVDHIVSGACGIGRFDQYFNRFRHDVLNRHIDLRLLDLFTSANTIKDARSTFGQIHDDLACEAKKFFSKENMMRDGRHASQFAFVPESLDVGEYLWERFCWASNNILVAQNPYMQLILLGRYLDHGSSSLPWLQKRFFEFLKHNLGRIVIHYGHVQDVCAGHGFGYFDKMNLSNIFEYMSNEAYEKVLISLCSEMKTGSRICYWNFLVERNSARISSKIIERDSALSNRLWRADRSWLYRAFHVDLVRPKGVMIE